MTIGFYIQWEKTIFVKGDNCISSGGFVIQAGENCFVSANSVDGGIGGYKTQDNWDPDDSLYDQWIVKFCDTSFFTPINLELDFEKQFYVFPNPSNGSIKINFNNAYQMETEILLRDISGRLIVKFLSGKYKFYEFYYDLNNLSPGIYYVCYKTNETLITKKLVLIR